MAALSGSRHSPDSTRRWGHFFATHVTDIPIVSKCDELRMPQVVGKGVPDEAIYGESSRSAHYEGREAGDIQQVDLITRRSEFRACRGHGDELYGTETIRKVYRKHGHQ